MTPRSSTSGTPRPVWDSIVSDYEARVEPFTASFVEEILQPVASDSREKSKLRLLDVGCGTGAVTLCARKMGLRVTATDVSSSMVERLRQRHAELYETENNDVNDMLEVRAVDGQELPESWRDLFDYAVGAFSVIFFPNVPKGLQEIYKCLVPGTGQMALSAWGSPEETPAFRVFPDAIKIVAPRLLADSKPKRITGSPAVLTSLLEEAGFTNIRVIGPVKRILRVSSSEAFYERFAKGSPNTMATMLRMTDEEKQQLKAKVTELAEARGGGRSDGSIEIPSLAYFAYGTKPGSP